MEQKLALKGRNYIDKANTKQINFFIKKAVSSPTEVKKRLNSKLPSYYPC